MASDQGSNDCSLMTGVRLPLLRTLPKPLEPTPSRLEFISTRLRLPMLMMNLTMIHVKMMWIPLLSQVSIARAPKSPANDDDAAPRTKGIFFRNFPVSIAALTSQKRGAALSSASKHSPLGKACSSNPHAGGGGNGGGSGGG
jgi:hypothetical protein